MLTRMNFGLHLASGRVAGVGLDLDALNGGREPESPEHALRTYAALMLPERDLDATVKRLEPLVRDPEVSGRVERAAAELDPEPDPDPPSAVAAARPGVAAGTTIETVVGLILGSPEFQRR